MSYVEYVSAVYGSQISMVKIISLSAAVVMLLCAK